MVFVSTFDALDSDEKKTEISVKKIIKVVYFRLAPHSFVCCISTLYLKRYTVYNESHAYITWNILKPYLYLLVEAMKI